jgi:hypothetical protein
LTIMDGWMDDDDDDDDDDALFWKKYCSFSK